MNRNEIRAAKQDAAARQSAIDAADSRPNARAVVKRSVNYWVVDMADIRAEDEVIYYNYVARKQQVIA